MTKAIHSPGTTIYTTLGTILTLIEKFPFIKYLANLQRVFTSVINFFKNKPIPDFDHVFYFKVNSEFAQTSSIPLVRSCSLFSTIHLYSDFWSSMSCSFQSPDRRPTN